MCALGWKTSIIENFCEVPLENDELYESVEIQTVSRDGFRGHTVLLRRLSGELDIAFDPDLALDQKWARTEPATAHQEIATLRPVQFRQIRCDVSSNAVRAVADFDDP